MFASSESSLQHFEALVARLLHRHQVDFDLLVQASTVLKSHSLAGYPEGQLVCGKMVLATLTQPARGNPERRLCFQPTISCQRGPEVKMWEASTTPTAGDHRQWLGYSDETSYLMPLRALRPQVKAILLPQFALMYQELLESGVVIPTHKSG